MATCTTIHLPTVLHFHPGSLATNQHFNMKLLTLSKGWCLFESTSTQGLICHIEECHRVSWVDFTAKGTRLNGRRKYFGDTFLCRMKYFSYTFSMYFLRPFSLVPLAVESTQLTLWHSSIWQINPWELLDSKRHQPLLNDKSFRLKCWFIAKAPGWKWRTVFLSLLSFFF